MKIVNTTRGSTLMQKGGVANTFSTRFFGLMGRKSLASGEGLIIIPNNSVHCFFMRFPIDVIFVSKEHQVVYIAPALKPWRISKIVRNAHYVIELAPDTAVKTSTQVGDVLQWQDEKTGKNFSPDKNGNPAKTAVKSSR